MQFQDITIDLIQVKRRVKKKKIKTVQRIIVTVHLELSRLLLFTVTYKAFKKIFHDLNRHLKYYRKVKAFFLTKKPNYIHNLIKNTL